jgi:hypothetical protein
MGERKRAGSVGHVVSIKMRNSIESFVGKLEWPLERSQYE